MRHRTLVIIRQAAPAQTVDAATDVFLAEALEPNVRTSYE